jgi:hypothetical protein
MPRCDGKTIKKHPCKNAALDNCLQCKWHIKCQGFTRTGALCRSRAIAELEYKYCRADHDPRLPTSTPTTEFRIDDLKRTMKSVVCEYRGGKDAYTLQAIRTSTDQLDHVVELHLLRDAYDRTCQGQSTTRSQQEKHKRLLFDVRTIANDKTNLNFTSASINNIKFEAYASFGNAFATNAVHDDGILCYLLAARTDSGHAPLTRLTSRRIRAEIEASGNTILDALNEKSGDSRTLHDQYMDDIQQVLESMKL